MKIELDGISLNEAQSRDGGIAEARSVSNVHATDNRNVVMHTVPGMEGSAIQDLGRTAVQVSFDGVVMGASAKSVVEMLRSKFKQGGPASFNSDISGMADVSKVVIEDLRVTEVAGNKGRYDYSIRLKEYMEPPAQSTAPPSQDEQAEQWADAAADETDKSINSLTGRVLGAEGNPMKGITVKATIEGEEYTGTTDEEGIYKIKNLKPGDYEVTVDAKGFEGIKQNVSIGKDGEGKGAEPGTGPKKGEDTGASAGEELEEPEKEEELVSPPPTVS